MLVLMSKRNSFFSKVPFARSKLSTPLICGTNDCRATLSVSRLKKQKKQKVEINVVQTLCKDLANECKQFIQMDSLIPCSIMSRAAQWICRCSATLEFKVLFFT